MKVKRLLGSLLIFSLILASASFSVNTFASVTTLINIDDQMSVNTSTRQVSQTGTVEFRAWAGSTNNMPSIFGAAQPNGTYYGQVTWKQRVMSQYLDHIYLHTPSTFAQSNATVIELKYKVKLDDYTIPSKPTAELRLNAPDIIQQGLGMDSTTPTQAQEDVWRTVKFVIDPVAKKTYSSYNGEDYRSSSFYGSPADPFGDVRIYMRAIPAASTKTDGETPLETPVTWTFDYIKVYQAPMDEVIPADSTSYLVKLTDSMTYTSGTYYDISQIGTVSWHAWAGSGATATKLTQLQKNPDGTFNQLDFRQQVMSQYKDNIQFTNPSDFTLDKPTVFEIKFKIRLDDYSVPNKPTSYININIPDVLQWQFTGVPSFTPEQADQDTWRTVKFVVDPVTQKVYSYYNGTTNSVPFYKSGLTSFNTVRIYTVSIPAASTRTDGVTPLETPVTWTFDSIKVYQDENAVATPTPTAPATNANINIDDQMSISGYTISQTGSVTFNAWAGQGINKMSTLTGLQGNGSTYDQIAIKQFASNQYKDHIAMTNPSAFSTTQKTTIELKYKLKLDDYTLANKPITELKLYIPNIISWTLGMPATVPSAAEQDNWRTVKFVIDPAAQTVSYRYNGGEVSTLPFESPANVTTYFSNVRLYLRAIEPGDTGSNDGGIALSDPVTWTFDYIKLYQSDYVAATPTSAPVQLAAPVTAGPWESYYYATGTGYDELAQFPEYVVDLGKLYYINKVKINHDSSKILSFSIVTSDDGDTYTPVTDVYSGGLDKYSGTQTYRFATRAARYVKYRPVLLGQYETQAKLTSITVSYTTTTAMSFIDVADKVNPVDTNEIILRANASDSDGDSYKLNRQGVTYELEGTIPQGITIDGNIITLTAVVSQSVLTVKASDASGAFSITKTIAVVPQVAVRNFSLYADSLCTTPLSSLTGGSDIYARVNIMASDAVVNKGIQLILAAYDKADGKAHLLKAAAVLSDAPVSGDYKAVTAKLTLPPVMSGNTMVKAYVWSQDTYSPLAMPVLYSPSGDDLGLTAQNLYLDKSDTFTIAASAPSGTVLWESSDDKVASVNAAGVVTGKSEGKAVITAKVNGNIIGTLTVKVKPSMYVYLLMGQSNMTGTNNPSNEGVTSLPISPGVMLLNKSGVFEPAMHKYSRHSGVTCSLPYHDASDNSSPLDGINMGYSFAEDFVSKNPGTQIGLVVNSQAGCSITVYERNSTDPLANGFANSLERVAQATSGNGELKAILWHQGETNSPESNYQYRLRNVIYDFRKELGNLELPFIAGGLCENNNAIVLFNDKVQKQEQNVANFGFASSRVPYVLPSRAVYDPTAPNDKTHFSVAGQIEFGHRYYNKLMEIERAAKS